MGLFNQKPQVTPQGRNGFDLSERNLFTAAPGQLIPVFAKDVIPGDKIKIRLQTFTRTQPLNSAAYSRIKEYYHCYFVPYKLLWQGWDNFIYGVDNVTSMFQTNGSFNGYETKKYTKCPSVDFSLLIGKGAGIDAASRDLLWKKKDEFGNYIINGAFKLLDMLGYNVLPVQGGYGQSVLAKNVRTVFPKNTEEFTYSTSELGKALGLNYPESNGKPHPFVEKRYNPFRLAAYQKIYQDYYMNEEYEKPDPLAWNFDDVDDTVDMKALFLMHEQTLGYPRLQKLLRLRYRNLERNLITSLSPTPLRNMFSYISSLSGSDYVKEIGFQFGQNVQIHLDRTNNNTVSIVPNNTQNAINTLAIKAAFALEKMISHTRKAGGLDYVSQTLAHYGIKVPEGRKNQAQYIGGTSNVVNVGEVVATASTDDAVVGQIFGKASSSNEDDVVNFDVKEHGVIMCIYSCAPLIDYPSYGVDEFNVKLKRGDYYHPEFQNLGLQPVFGRILVNSPFAGYSISDKLLGYGPQYYEYKTSLDKIHGEFTPMGTLNMWSTPHDTNQLVNKDIYSPFGNENVLDDIQYDVSDENQGETLAYSLDDNYYGLPPRSFKVNPNILNSISTIRYDGRESSEPLMVNCYSFINAVRPISVVGENA